MYFSHKPFFFLYWAKFSEEPKFENNFALPFKKLKAFFSIHRLLPVTTTIFQVHLLILSITLVYFSPS